jgi:hypothetical protein
MKCSGLNGINFVLFKCSFSLSLQDELVNLQDASNEVMMIMDDEELVKVTIQFL